MFQGIQSSSDKFAYAENDCKYVEIKGVPLPQCFARRKNPTALPFSKFLFSLSPDILKVDVSKTA